MSTILKHKKSGKHFVLIGTGFGAYKASHPSLIFGSLLPDEEYGSQPMGAICDRKGAILWGASKDFTVVQVDSKPLASLFPKSKK